MSWSGFVVGEDGIYDYRFGIAREGMEEMERRRLVNQWVCRKGGERLPKGRGLSLSVTHTR